MTNDAQAPPTPGSDERPGVWFERAAFFFVLAGPALGGLAAWRILAEEGPGATAVADACYWGVLHAAGSLLAAVPVRALGAWLDSRAPGTAGVFAASTAPLAQPPAAAIEAEPDRESPADPLGEVRRLIDAGEWDEAAERARALAVERAGEPGVAAVVEEVEKGRRAAGLRLREEMQAAREVNDPSRVLDLYESAPRVLDEEDRRELEQDLAKWFLTLVHRRLRSGVLQVDVVTLVDRVSEKFGHTKEGASLRAALPTLRRGAGLCPRCAKPYVGFSEACPECLGRPEPPPPIIPGLVADDPPEEEVDEVGRLGEPSWFLDPDEEPGANGRPSP